MYSPIITFKPSTSKYHVRFNGKRIQTVLTEKAAIASEWIQEILAIYSPKPTVVGLDIEWRPHAIQSMSNKSATLQLCIDDKCLIFQLLYIDFIPQALKNFLLDPNFTFVGIKIGDDIMKLKDEFGLVCRNHEDIRVWVMRGRPCRFCLPRSRDIVDEICNLHMKKSKHECMSNEKRARRPSHYQALMLTLLTKLITDSLSESDHGVL